MLTAERRRYILEVLRREGKVVASALSEELGTSEDTIRRDLRDLSSEGLLLRVHGGALPVSPATASFASRRDQSAPAKRVIAQAAAGLVRPGQVVLLDGGTTNLQVAELLPATLEATVVTNSPPVAVALADHPRVAVILLGGQLDKHSLVTRGEATLDGLRMVRPDLYLLGICSLHPELGISTPSLHEAYLKRAMIAAAAEVVALASPEKLNTAAPYVVGPLTELSEIITNRTVDEETLRPYRDLGITMTRV
jgi:DeoR/GlpR family transcriptional regulator of sugar metabolism